MSYRFIQVHKFKCELPILQSIGDSQKPLISGDRLTRTSEKVGNRKLSVCFKTQNEF